MFQLITAKASKRELMQSYNTLTLPALVKESFPTVGELTRTQGDELVEKCICVLVSDLNESFDGELSTENIEEIALECTTGLIRNHSLESIYYTLKELKSSKVYGKLTVNKVLSALKESFNEISDAIALRNYNYHLAGKFVDNRETSTERTERLKKDLHLAKTYLQIENHLKNDKK